MERRNIVPERLKEARLAMGYSASELAERLEVTRQVIYQYELGHTSPSASTMAKMLEVLDFPISFYSKPINDTKPLTSSTFFRSLKSSDKKVQEMLIIRSGWLEEIYSYIEQYINFPPKNLPNLNNFMRNEPYTPEDIENIAQFVREAWNLGLGPINNIVLLLEKHGVIMARAKIYDHKVDACSQWRGDRPIIFLSSDKGSAVRSRFDAAHELGHLLLHMDIDPDQLNDKKVMDRIEKEANTFASAFLLPKETFSKEIISTSLSHFIALKRRWKISIAAMIYRCESLGILSDSQILYLRKQMSIKKMRTCEPLDDEIPTEKPTVLKQAVEMLLNNNVETPATLIENFCLPIRELENLCYLDPGTLSFKNNVITLQFKSENA